MVSARHLSSAARPIEPEAAYRSVEVELESCYAREPLQNVLTLSRSQEVQ